MQEKYIQALSQLEDKGWGIIPDICKSDSCDRITETLNYKKFALNSNQPRTTLLGLTKFNTNVLACSKDAVDVVINEELRELAANYLGRKPILKCIRTYTINKKAPLFTWHADNVNPVTFETDESRGINCILYLEDDLIDRTFSVAENIFHSRERKIAKPTKSEIKIWKENKKIIKIPAKKGDMVIFRQDIYHQHVAVKVDKLDALWFQMVEEGKALNEKIIVDISYIPKDPSVMNFLGSGSKNIGTSNPPTKIYQLPSKELFAIGLYCFSIIPSSLFITVGKKIDKFLYFKLGIDLTSTRSLFKKIVHKTLNK